MTAHKYITDFDTTHDLLAAKHDRAMAAGKERLADAIFVEMVEYAAMQNEAIKEAAG